MITVISLLVDDYEKARDWYVEKLGFTVKMDMPFGNGERWLTIAPPIKGGAELSLCLAKTETDKAAIGKQAGDYSYIVLISLDVEADRKKYEAAGVEFIAPIAKQQWGTDTLFKDLYGNKIYVLQPAPMEAEPALN